MKHRFHLLVLLPVVLLLAAGCDNNHSDSGATAGKVADKSALLATITDEGSPQPVPPSLGMGLHAPQPPDTQLVFSRDGGGVAYSVENKDYIYVVHNGRAAKPYKAIGEIALTPDGRRIAYGALIDGKWRMVVDGVEGAAFSTVKAPLFSPDGKHVAYQAMSGEKWYLVVDTLPNTGTQTRILGHQFSGDSTKIAYIDNVDEKNRGRLVISDLTFSKQTVITPSTSQMTVNQDASRIAAISISDKGEQIVECSFDRPDTIKTGPRYSAIQYPAFAPDRATLAYVAERDARRVIVLNDREAALPQGESLASPPVVRPDLKGVGAIFSANNQVYFKQYFLDGEQKQQGYDEANGLIYSRDGKAYAFAARKGNSWFVVTNGVEGAGFDMVVTPKFSPNGKYLVYRARKDGKRFVVVADKGGKIKRQHPAYEQVFDVVFTSDGKSVVYGVKDGNKLLWQVESL